MLEDSQVDAEAAWPDDPTCNSFGYVTFSVKRSKDGKIHPTWPLNARNLS